VFSLLAFYVFAIGACVGSFLNVVIHRIPIEESIVFPPSRCPGCRHGIAWYDNIPVLSYLLLRGRCRNCGEPISLRYPLVETANALFYLAIYLRTGFSIASLLLAALVSMTIALIYIDADIQILPDVIDLPGVAIGILLSLVPRADDSLTLAGDLLHSVAGAIAGAAVLLAVSLAYRLLRGVEGMGLGDVKMLAMIGATLGPRALFSVLLLASVTGALVGLAMMAVTRRNNLQFALPFGVFLGIAFLANLFFGHDIYQLLPALQLWP